MLKKYGITEVECAAESPDELAFLRRIVENLSAPLPKLVFADWLEDRGDPRGPFLRTFVEAAADPKDELPSAEGFTRPWLDMVGVHAVVEIRKWVREVWDLFEAPERVFDGFETHLLRLARPRLILLPTPAADEDIPVGESKYGGCPDLPAGESWPIMSCAAANIRHTSAANCNSATCVIWSSGTRSLRQGYCRSM